MVEKLVNDLPNFDRSLIPCYLIVEIFRNTTVADSLVLCEVTASPR